MDIYLASPINYLASASISSNSSGNLVLHIIGGTNYLTQAMFAK